MKEKKFITTSLREDLDVETETLTGICKGSPILVDVKSTIRDSGQFWVDVITEERKNLSIPLCCLYLTKAQKEEVMRFNPNVNLNDFRVIFVKIEKEIVECNKLLAEIGVPVVK